MNLNYKKSFVKGALILTVAAFVSKILSAFYRVPLQNFSGDLGFYIYQQIYPFVGMVMILSIYSFPSAISNLATKIIKERGKLSLFSFYLPILIILFVINGLIFLLLFYFAKPLSDMIGDRSLSVAFSTLSFAFLIIPIIALIRGVFQSYGEMKPTAYSQVADQFIRVLMIVLVSYIIYRKDWDIYLIGQYGALATIGGLLVSFIILIVFFIMFRPFSLNRHFIPWTFYIRTLIVFGFVASLNHMVLLIIQLADVLTLIPSLVDYGYSFIDAQRLKGVFDRGQPLIQFGMVIGSSFALALIPAVANNALHKKEVVDAFFISFYIASGATAGLIVLMPEVNMLLFKDTLETTSLRILVMAIFLCSIIITVNALLQSLGMMIKTAVYILLTFCLKVILNILTVPLLGLIGSALATIISLIVLFTISFFQLYRRIPTFNLFRFVKWRYFWLSMLSMVTYLLLFKIFIHVEFFQSRFILLIYVLFLVITGAFIYLLMLIRLDVLSKEQLNVLPFNRYLSKLRR